MRLPILPSVVSMVALGGLGCISFSPQTETITRKFFANPGLEIDTPAFRKSSGFTSHSELMGFLLEETLSAEEPNRVRLDTLGRTQQGRDIPVVFLGTTSSTTKPTRVWFQGGLHGNEPASSEGLLLFLQKALKDPELQRLRAGVELAIVPVANPDGYQVQGRYAANGLDLNRDQTKLMVPETRILKRAFNAFTPDVAVDFHEFRPYRRDFIHLGERGISHAYDVMFLYSGNLNVPEPLRSFTQTAFVAPAKTALEERGLRTYDYITSTRVYGDIHFNLGSTNARSSATSFALANTVSTLIEVRGVGLGRDAFERRVMSTYWVALSYLKTAAARADDIRTALRASRDAKLPIAVRSTRRVEPRTIQAIDLRHEELSDVKVTVRNALASSPELVRPTPAGYVLTISQTDLIERLKTLGLEVHRLAEETALVVERYRVTQYRRHPQSYEGTRRQTVECELSSDKMVFPAGTFVVWMDQRRSRLAAEVLEPEADNSFVSFGVLKTSAGEELPVYRALTKAGPAAGAKN